MKQKLYLTALITSPIIALYGASPFLIFEKVSLGDYLELFIGICFAVFINWMVIIFLNNKYPKLNNISLFFLAYVFNISIRIILDLAGTYLFKISKPPLYNNEIMYPIATSFAVNLIILIVVKSMITAYEKGVTEKELQELKLQNSEAQKQMLSQQLQPHFLFNSLSTLKALIGENVELAEEYTLKLSDFLRYSIQSGNVDVIELKKELEFVQDYIDLQKIRFGDTIEYTINIDEEHVNKKLPILAIQTLVENIFKHNHFTSKNKLKFTIEVTGGHLKVSNYKNTIKETPQTKTGLINLNKRYQLICGQSIVIEDHEDSFNVTIPLI